MPERIQRKRTRGWKMPENSVSVTRPGPFGNPFYAKDAAEAGYLQPAEMAVTAFRKWLAGDPDFRRVNFGENDPGRDFILANVGSLRGKNLACFCRLDQPCHADVLLKLANATSSVSSPSRARTPEQSS